MIHLTYADVLLKPKRTPLKSRSEAKTNTKVTKNIALNLPLIASNMASVTEHKMAIAMARAGGLGIIHQFLPIEEQAHEVTRVKRSTSTIIENPTSITPEIAIKEALDIMAYENVTSLLVNNKETQKLEGIFTSRDYLFEEDYTKKISEVMTTNVITAPHDIEINEAKKILHKHRIEKLPLVKDNVVVGLMTTQDIKKLEQWPHAARDTKGRLLVGAAVGVKDAIERSKALEKAGADLIVLDIAHAHSDYFIETLKQLKKEINIDILAGNIATAEAAHDLIEAGADGLKVGVGPSPVCTTRIVAGAGVPQISAIKEIYTVAKEHGVPICADGGITFPGDVVKAIVAGADTIMSGSIFAGTDEAPQPIIIKDGKRFKKYFGSASFESSVYRKQVLEKVRVKETLSTFVEGESKLVPYKGPVSHILDAFKRGIQSGISYAGAIDLATLKTNGELIRISNSSWKESLDREVNH